MLLAALLGAGCGAPTKHVAVPTGDTLPDVVATGSVSVLADPALTTALTDNKARLAVDNAALKVGMTFGSTSAPNGADVIAGTATALDALRASGAVGKATPFARDDLEVVISPGNPKQLTAASDLARPGLRVLAAGDAAQSAAAKLVVGVTPVTDLAAAIDAVNAGRADALVVYASEVAGKAADLRLSIPSDQNVPRLYSAAVVKGTANRGAAEAFIDQLISGVGSQAVQGGGFHLP